MEICFRFRAAVCAVCGREKIEIYTLLKGTKL